mmetsp:Transcript_76211/g.170455  ORF Transcript_76211/g.170455 Transcript_76211/m.170455 type:complete len:233 (+) Transcript_76211:151-849(+)
MASRTSRTYGSTSSRRSHRRGSSCSCSCGCQKLRWRAEPHQQSVPAGLPWRMCASPTPVVPNIWCYPTLALSPTLVTSLPLLVKVAPASRPLAGCSCGSTTLARGGSCSTVWIIGVWTCVGCGHRLASSSRSQCCLTAPFPRTSRTAPRVGVHSPKSKLLLKRQTRTISSAICKTVTTLTRASGQHAFRAARSSALPSRVLSSAIQRCCCWTRQRAPWTARMKTSFSRPSMS